MNFASDNNAGIHPHVLRAIEAANHGHAVAYGADTWTDRARNRFREVFGDQSEAFFVFNGTAANVLSLQSVVRSFHSVICGEYAHLASDECGAPEKSLGAKLVLVPVTLGGKLTPERVLEAVKGAGDPHHSQARAVSITQSTEFGSVYSANEIKALAEAAHSKGLILHMDGARIANAAASLGVSLRAITADCGVDVLSFGGTKNGLLLGEAVVFLNPSLVPDFQFLRKQGMQLASKMRFLAAQFEALFTDDLWLKNALQANRMAKLLESRLRAIPLLEISRPVEANAVFAVMPDRLIPLLQREYYFHVWAPAPALAQDGPRSEARSEVRLMCSFNTEESHVLDFSEKAKRIFSE